MSLMHINRNEIRVFHPNLHCFSKVPQWNAECIFKWCHLLPKAFLTLAFEMAIRKPLQVTKVYLIALETQDTFLWSSFPSPPFSSYFLLSSCPRASYCWQRSRDPRKGHYKLKQALLSKRYLPQHSPQDACVHCSKLVLAGVAELADLRLEHRVSV